MSNEPVIIKSNPAPNCTLEETTHGGERTVAVLTGPGGRFFWNRYYDLWMGDECVCSYEHALKLARQ